MNSSTSAITPRHSTASGSSGARQPQRSIIQAATGRQISWPVAALAVRIPMTSPRRDANQRLETTAPSTSAVMPLPSPSTTPHSTTRCQSCVTSPAISIPPPTSASATLTTARTPKRSISTAANGPIRPNSAKRSARAEEIWLVDQPNSCASGCSIAPGRPSAADMNSIVRKVSPAITQLKWRPRWVRRWDRAAAGMRFLRVPASAPGRHAAPSGRF